MTDVGSGESHADSYWTLDAAGGRHVFIGDVVLHGVHAYVSDGHTTPWLNTLQRLHTDLSGVKTVYPGHGGAGGLDLLDWESGYLKAYRAEVDRLREGGKQLSDADKAALIGRMKALYPQAGLQFLIGRGADAVASELNSVQ